MSKRGKMLENLALISHVGISMIIPIGVSIYIGRQIDLYFGTEPIFLFVFIVIGVISAFTSLFRLTSKDIKSKQRK